MRASASWLLLAVLTACDRSDAPASGTVTVAATPVPIASPLSTSPTRTADRIERLSPAAANATAAATPARAMRPTRDFTDPPLPRELADDGDLAPLPPRPTPIQAEEDQR